jgi:hypothetical protein
VITGSLVDYSVFDTVQVMISVKCAVGSLQSVQEDMLVTYVPGLVPLQIQIFDFI